MPYIINENNDVHSTEKEATASVPGKILRFSKGEFVFKEGESCNEIYVIQSGCVKLVKNNFSGLEIVKSIMGKGHFFGERALIGEKKRLSNAQAVINDTVLHIYKVEDVLNNLVNDPALKKCVLEIFDKKVAILEDRLESIISKDSRTRIIDFLREIAVESGEKVGFEVLIKNSFAHKDIASLTGTSRQTVTTILNNLKDKNIINFDRKRILIRDMELLK